MESIKRRPPRKITPELRDNIHAMIDSVFFEGANYNYADIAKTNGISERQVNAMFCARLKHNQKIIAEQKRLAKLEERGEQEIFQAITIVGRKELINGKLCHVYPSRMNYENT
jgi:hypothetical protein